MENLQVLILPTILLVIFGYLFGSVSSSIIITKIFTKDDIRNHGSGNAGMTNVLRTAGKIPAVLTFVFDFLKCVIPALVSYFIIISICTNNNMNLDIAIVVKAIVGLACVVGHIFPAYFGFRGGKGVVTTSAMIAIVDWRVFILVIAAFIITFAVKKIVSLASLVAAIVYPFATAFILFVFDYQSGTMNLTYINIMIAIAFVASIIVVIKHKTNIKRLINGEEKPIFTKK